MFLCGCIYVGKPLPCSRRSVSQTRSDSKQRDSRGGVEKKKLGSFGSGREMKDPTQTSLVFVPLLLSHRSLFRSASQIERLEKA